LAESRCDVLVVGGGINGCGIARDLAGRGWKVLLVEQDDLASHTSSASTKLIHGGLRYLEYYEFGLVRKALQEREVLLRSAPHIMWPLRFVMPHDPAMRPAWMIRLGLFFYVPLQARFTHGFVYSDGWVDDARLVVLNAIDAREHGAEIATRTRCTAALRGADGWRASLRANDGTERHVCARALVNAAGPWAEAFLRGVAKPAHGEALATKSLRLVKGSHIVVPKLFAHDHAYILQNPDKRIIFAIPYEGDFTLIGTTDVEQQGDPGGARIAADEVSYLCEQASRYFKQAVTARDVRWSYSGVRPLLDDGADASAVTRDYLLESQEAPAPLLSVWGGKITTFRKLAEEAADEVSRLLGERRPAWTEGQPLPGGDLSGWIGAPGRPDHDFERFVQALQSRHAALAPRHARRLARAYGSRVERVLARAPGAEIAPGLFENELRYLCDEEWAVSAQDVLWRRSKLGLHLKADECRRVAEYLGEGAAVVEAPCS
jgi:glycerol-3-phosphate dehydrogenase